MARVKPTKREGWLPLFSVGVKECEEHSLSLYDNWNSLYNIQKNISLVVLRAFLGEYAVYILKYWESFIFIINLRENGDAFYFSCRWEIPDNQVLVTKLWQQAADHFSWKGDNGEKMEHTVSYFFLLIPLPLEHRGLWDFVYRQNASPTSTKKKLFIS